MRLVSCRFLYVSCALMLCIATLPSAALAGLEAGRLRAVACAGDCDGDGRVTIDDVVTMITIALGESAVTRCAAGDLDANDGITVDEILVAVRGIFEGCPTPLPDTPPPTATATPPLTATVTASPTRTPTSTVCMATPAPDDIAITQAECDSGAVLDLPQNNVVQLSGGREGLTVTMGTAKHAYSTADACVPIIVTVTNTSAAPIVWQTDELEVLANLLVGIHSPVVTSFQRRAFDVPLPHWLPAEMGTTLNPGETVSFANTVPVERLQLYNAPPLGGGLVERPFSFRGPVSGLRDQRGVLMRPPTLLGSGRLESCLTVDFGDLPETRVFDPGAGRDFVPGILAVAFKAGVSLAEAESIIRRHASYIAGNFSWRLMNTPIVFEIQIPFHATTLSMITVFHATEPSIQYAHPNYYIFIIAGD